MGNAQDTGDLVYTYHYRFDSGKTIRLPVRLDPETLSCRKAPSDPPDWSRLDVHQCPNCPLRQEEHPNCPPAANMAEIIEAFRDVKSYRNVEVTVEAPGRSYVKLTTAQKGVAPLIGLVMASSGCPILDKLRPMVATHLPFMTQGESTHRTVAMYLMAQYFRMKKGLTPDWSLAKLLHLFRELQTINTAFCKRISVLKPADASVNAVVILNCLGSMTGFSIEQDDLDRLGRLFEAHGIENC